MLLTNLIPVTLSFIQVVAASSFHKTLHGVQEAHDKLFHDSLKQQLDTSRGKNASISDTLLPVSTTANFAVNDNTTNTDTLVLSVYTQLGVAKHLFNNMRFFIVGLSHYQVQDHIRH